MMVELSKRHKQPEPDLRRIIALEFVAAAAVLIVIAAALYLVLTYKP